jgi:predicted nucleic acid-binding protein
VKIYVDSSALIKRAEQEDFSQDLKVRLAFAVQAGDLLEASSLAWIEVERTLRKKHSVKGLGPRELANAASVAFSGVDELLLSDRVARTARWIGSDALRSLDAIHLATAVLDGAEVMLTYDKRLADAARTVGIRPEAPGTEI